MRRERLRQGIWANRRRGEGGEKARAVPFFERRRCRAGTKAHRRASVVEERERRICIGRGVRRRSRNERAADESDNDEDSEEPERGD